MQFPYVELADESLYDAAAAARVGVTPAMAAGLAVRLGRSMAKLASIVSLPDDLASMPANRALPPAASERVRGLGWFIGRLEHLRRSGTARAGSGEDTVGVVGLRMAQHAGARAGRRGAPCLARHDVRPARGSPAL